MKKTKLIKIIAFVTILLTLVTNFGIVTFAEERDYPIFKMCIEKSE